MSGKLSFTGVSGTEAIAAKQAANGLSAEEVAHALSKQPIATRDVQWHLADIQSAFERGELTFYLYGNPKGPKEFISAYEAYRARFNGSHPRVTLLSETSLYTNACDVNVWLERRGSGYRLPNDRPVQTDAVAAAPVTGGEVWKERALEYAPDIWLQEFESHGRDMPIKELAAVIASRLTKQRYRTVRNKEIDGAYVERHVLRGWKPPQIHE